MSNPVSVQPGTADLYETDLCLWTERQAALLRAGRWREVDALHLAEEIESVGGSQKSEIRNRLVVLLLHLLKWEFQPEKRKYGWRASIIDQRLQIAGVIEVSPSLRGWPDHVVAATYRQAVVGAASETGLPEKAFPATCPYAISEILDIGFYPGLPEADVV